MALPKYKTSRANTHSRRANWKATAAATVNCPNCGARPCRTWLARAAVTTAAAPYRPPSSRLTPVSPAITA